MAEFVQNGKEVCLRDYQRGYEIAKEHKLLVENPIGDIDQLQSIVFLMAIMARIFFGLIYPDFQKNLSMPSEYQAILEFFKTYRNHLEAFFLIASILIHPLTLPFRSETFQIDVVDSIDVTAKHHRRLWLLARISKYISELVSYGLSLVILCLGFVCFSQSQYALVLVLLSNTLIIILRVWDTAKLAKYTDYMENKNIVVYELMLMTLAFINLCLAGIEAILSSTY